MRIRTDGLAWGPGGTPIIRDISFTLAPGRVLGVVGPNGAGKSSLLRCLAGLQRPTAGVVTYGDTDAFAMTASTRAKLVAFVEQHAHTDADLTVREVVELGRIPHRKRLARPTADDDLVIAAAIKRLGLVGYEGQRWVTLSGGERQRAYLAKALAQQPKALILDEPTNHLDVKHQFDILHHLAHAEVSVIVALHDLRMAASYCDEIIVLHEGRLVAHEIPPAALTPQRIREVFEVDAGIVSQGDRSHLILRRLTDEHARELPGVGTATH